MWQDSTGYEWTIYVGFLTYPNARKVVTTMPKHEWEREHEYVTSKPISQLALDYIDAAERKLHDPETHQNRMLKTLQHCVAWFWLMGDSKYATDIARYVFEQPVYSIEKLDEIKERLQSNEE